VDYRVEGGLLRVVDSIDFTVRSGQTVGIVGESGAGKSSVALAVMGLLPRTAIVSGKVLVQGRDINLLRDQDLRKVRGRNIAIVFQNPQSSLNPSFSVGSQITEAIHLHTPLNKNDAQERMRSLLRRVGLDPDRSNAYPHQLSGGMRQRVMLAIAIACNPSVLVADEPTTALDVTVQAQILDLITDLQSASRLATLVISHDLGVIARLADWLVVMYAGRVIEQGPVETLFRSPTHPYTWSLLQAVPRLDGSRELSAIPGEPGSRRSRLRDRCGFEDRCPFAEEICREHSPELREIASKHSAACHFAPDIASRFASNE
jgi:oligopeptide/dipeptide ABC transporter ATP-binding protein